MAVFDGPGIRKNAKADFIATWLSTAAMVPKNTTVKLPARGKSHPLRDLMQRSREVLLARGFDEAENLTILPDSDVTKQYGPEALVILDRAFYLAELPRPEIGVSQQRIQQIEKIVGRSVSVEELGGILRAYKRGDIEADDLIDEMMKRLGIIDTQATEIINKVFPELYQLKPVPTDRTLRSHMTATWFHTLAAIQDKATYPVALFAVGPRYRNEQREDAHHLRVHHSASIVIMDPEMSLEAGRALTTDVLKDFGFEDVRFETKSATSKYYTPGLEEEVFVKYRGEWLEVADIGMYSPVALANFEIRYPVFNAGMGMERLAMILHGADDIRKLVFPQFSVVDFGDKDIAESLAPISAPKTERGMKIARAIEGSARKHKDEIAPCDFIAFRDNKVEVKLVEREAGKKLIGPAGFNELCVADGTIYSDLEPTGTYTGYSYMRGVSLAAAALAESAAEPTEYQVKMIRHLSDVNLELPDAVRQHIERQQKKIGIGGGMFVTVVISPIIES
ncbi:MAG: O-phosphoserine--tRNA ligase [Dehalococcoidia bacterium]|nr:O-phosphoserine--tRNA ligase [Dehalococcoidia bacterium]